MDFGRIGIIIYVVSAIVSAMVFFVVLATLKREKAKTSAIDALVSTPETIATEFRRVFKDLNLITQSLSDTERDIYNKIYTLRLSDEATAKSLGVRKPNVRLQRLRLLRQFRRRVHDEQLTSDLKVIYRKHTSTK
jgi:flagellar basal body-associated protein FliL